MTEKDKKLARYIYIYNPNILFFPFILPWWVQRVCVIERWQPSASSEIKIKGLQRQMNLHNGEVIELKDQPPPGQTSLYFLPGVRIYSSFFTLLSPDEFAFHLFP